MSLAIKFQSLVMIPSILGLFCENICDICTLCEVVQNMSEISKSNEDQNLVFYLHSHGKVFLFKTIISCILIGKME